MPECQAKQDTPSYYDSIRRYNILEAKETTHFLSQETDINACVYTQAVTNTKNTLSKHKVAVVTPQQYI